MTTYVSMHGVKWISVYKPNRLSEGGISQSIVIQLSNGERQYMSLHYESGDESQAMPEFNMGAEWRQQMEQLEQQWVLEKEANNGSASVSGNSRRDGGTGKGGDLQGPEKHATGI